MPNDTTPWPRETEDRARSMIALGYSASQVTAAIGRSRDAVLGKVRRRGWKLHNPCGWPKRSKAIP